MSSTKNFVDLRNIGSVGGVKFKKGVDESVKFSLLAIKRGETTLTKQLNFFNSMIEREKNGGKKEYIELFKQVKDRLKKQYSSPRSKNTPVKSLKKKSAKQ